MHQTAAMCCYPGAVVYVATVVTYSQQPAATAVQALAMQPMLAMSDFFTYSCTLKSGRTLNLPAPVIPEPSHLALAVGEEA